MAEKAESISVGYALPPKKVESVFQPSLINHAKEKGIEFIAINLEKSLLEQGPFHCIVHKIYSQDWNNQLLEFKAKHPKIPIIDHPSSVQLLRNRITMLEFIKKLTISSSNNSNDVTPSFGMPKQVLLTPKKEQEQQEDDDDDDDDDGEFHELGLIKFPVIAKPLMVDGSLKSHQMSMVFNKNGLQKVKEQKIPIVLQEFVNHGGKLFKVYVAGNHVKCVQRDSLPDFQVSDHPFFQLQEGFMPFSQISNMPSEVTEKQQKIDDISMPPLEFVQNLSAAISQETHLSLFNFDLIKDSSETNCDKYLVIDINYFPGFAKLPGYEAMLTDFFLDAVNNYSTDA